MVVKGSRDLFLEFLGPPPYLEWLKLETSDFAHKLASGEPNEKMQYYIKEGRDGVTWPTFIILGPLHISEMVEATNFKFGTQIGH